MVHGVHVARVFSGLYPRIQVWESTSNAHTFESQFESWSKWGLVKKVDFHATIFTLF